MKKITFLLFLLPFLCNAQLPIVNGWTKFTPSNDSRIIYVSASSGNDTTGQLYSSTSPQIGTDPFNPVGSINAYQTLTAATAQLRNGFADWILFKKGDIFLNQYFGVTTRFGKNSSEPMLIGSYGSAIKRPLILTGNQGFIDFTGISASNIAIVGLHIEPNNRTGSDEPIGIRIINAPFDNILIEDCFISKYFTNVTVHDPALPAVPTRTNLKVRRSVLADAYVTTSSHANAMFIANVDTILFEENLLDHNGWSASISGADPTGFRHNSYFQVSCANLSFRENIVARAAATGGGFRCGGVVYNNTFLSNPKNIQFGTHETTINWPTSFVFGSISYNVIMDSRVTTFETGKGLTAQRAKNTAIHHNIIAHFTPVSDYNLGLFFNETENMNINNNIIYNWGNNTSSGPAYSGGIVAGNTLLGMNKIDSNDVQMKNLKGHCAIKYGTFSNVSYAQNRYYNSATAGNWFDPSGSFSNWLTQSGEMGALSINIPYLDANRTVSSYLSSLSLSGGLDEFLNYRKGLSKINWDINFTANTFNNYIRFGFGINTLNTTDLVDSQEEGVIVFPNPSTTGIFSINLPDNFITTATVYDYSGKMILNKEIKDSAFEIDISSYPIGQYLIHLRNKKQHRTIKVNKL